MKNVNAWIAYLGLGTSWLLGAPAVSNTTITERGPHHRSVLHVTSVSADGRTTLSTNRYTELATGFHYLHNGEWLESREIIEIVPGGALASQGPHQVGFAANINTLGAVNMVTPDGKRLRSHVLGLAFTDAQTGQSVLFAPIQDSIGVLVGDNQVIYSNAFAADGFSADIRFTYRRGSFEQDIILRTAVPDPALFGLNAASTRLEVFTEFVEAPAPNLTQRIISSVEEPLQRAAMAIPDFIDQQLNFGAMQIFGGRAFPVGGETDLDGSIVTAKTWEQREGRVFLIEAVRYAEVKPYLDQLAAFVPVNQPDAWPKAQAGRRFPVAPQQARNETRTVRMAGLKEPQAGFVIDYEITASASNFTFKGDTTYFMTGLMEMTGTTVFEGGAVLKYTNRTTGRPRLHIKGPAEFRTNPYLPVVFTAKDDNSFGAVISGATGTPTGLYADLALRLDNASEFFQISNIVMGYAFEGISAGSTGGNPNKYAVWDALFFKCSFACRTASTNMFRNCLFSLCNTAFIVSSATNDAQNITVAQCGTIASVGAPGTLYATNSLFVANTNLTGLGGGAYNGTNSSFSSVFETVGHGNHYLKDDTYRGAGTVNVDTRLLGTLRRRTTYSPLSLTNLVAADLTLAPIVPTDNNTALDLGYHYSVIDYLVDSVVLSNATLTLTGGVALGISYPGGASGYGFLLKDSRILSMGSPTNLNRLVRAHMVQEQSGSNPPTRAIFYDGGSPNASNEIRARFTLFAQLADDGPLLSSGQKLRALELTHSSVYNPNLVVDADGSNLLTCGLTNTLWERGLSQFGVANAGASSVVHARNNLFKGHTAHFVGAESSWSVKDNLIDSGGLDDHGTTVTNGYNASYFATTNFSGGTSNLTLTNLTYLTGPLGKYYQPTNSALLNYGSQNATNSGLYHFTTTTNQVKETNSIVDIGLHYVATDANGTPLDFDGDGVPDYYEDTNGNGSHDAGEINWVDSDTDDDGVPDGIELLQGRNPLGGTLADTNNILNLRVFTPLH